MAILSSLTLEGPLGKFANQFIEELLHLCHAVAFHVEVSHGFLDLQVAKNQPKSPVILTAKQLFPEVYWEAPRCP